MSRSTAELLREALVHLDLVREYAADADLGQQLAVDAVCMRLSAGIEVLARLDPEVRARLFGDRWPLMAGMRNRIAHGYVLVDSGIVRRTVLIDLPNMVDVINRELAAT